MDEEDSDSPKTPRLNRQQESKRKERRKSAQDMNRPRLNEKSSSNESNNSPVLIDEDSEDGGWLEYNDDADETKSSRRSSSKLDESIEYIRQAEEYQKRQRKMRRRSFTKRRNSFIKMTSKIVSNTPPLANDFDKFKSCLSLRSEGSFSGENFTHIHKSITKNFINSHVEQVSRISDIFVPQKRENRCLEKNSDDFKWNLNIKDVTKPSLLVLIVLLVIGILALFSYVNRL